MAIKKANKVKADFSMSSLTDVIFLLLIFFVLTSDFVTENGFKLQLPEGANQTLEQETLVLAIEEDKTYLIGPPKASRADMVEVSKENIETELANRLQGKKEFSATIVLKAHEDIPIKEITYVMTIGARIKQRVILATETSK